MIILKVYHPVLMQSAICSSVIIHHYVVTRADGILALFMLILTNHCIIIHSINKNKPVNITTEKDGHQLCLYEAS